MGYQVKWVEDNLGITRKALRVYEKKGLIPENQNSQYREYDDEDLDRIWAIKIMQGMGYSLNELVNIKEHAADSDFDFLASITQKVAELEEKKAEIERHIGYAKMIQLSGRFPLRPKELGSVTVHEFQQNSLNEWTVNDNAVATPMYHFVEQILDQPMEEWGETELENLLKLMLELSVHKEEMESLMELHVLLKGIISRMHQGISSPEVQLLVNLFYEKVSVQNGAGEISPEQFGRLFSSSYKEGLVGQMNRQKYGASECDFLADAMAFFGGYQSYEEIP